MALVILALSIKTRLRGATVEQDGAGRCQFGGLSHLLADEVRLFVEEGCGEFGPHIRPGLDVVNPVGHFMADVISPSLQGCQLLLEGVGRGRESLAHGMDDAGMRDVSIQVSVERPHASSSVGSQLGVFEGFALQELWFEPVDGVWEP
jgi:hypothetical protein